MIKLSVGREWKFFASKKFPTDSRRLNAENAEMKERIEKKCRKRRKEFDLVFKFLQKFES